MTSSGGDAIELGEMDEGVDKGGGAEGGVAEGGGGVGEGVDGGGRRSGASAGAIEIINIESDDEDANSTTTDEHHASKLSSSHFQEGGLDEQMLIDVLATRPTLQLGRSMSVRYRGGRNRAPLFRSESAHHRRVDTTEEERVAQKRGVSAPGQTYSKK